MSKKQGRRKGQPGAAPKRAASRIIVFCPYPQHPHSYRAVACFRALESLGHDVRLVAEPSAATIDDGDAFYVQAPASLNEHAFSEWAVKRGKQLVLDVPVDIAGYLHWGAVDEGLTQALRTTRVLMPLAHAVSAPSEAVAKQLSAFTDSVAVVPDLADLVVWEHQPRRLARSQAGVAEDDIVIGWAGSDPGALNRFAGALQAALEVEPRARLMLVRAAEPVEGLPEGRQLVVQPQRAPELMACLMSADIALVDSPAALGGRAAPIQPVLSWAMAGAAIVAEAAPPYAELERGGLRMLLASDEEEAAGHLRRLLSDQAERTAMAEVAAEHVAANLSVQSRAKLWEAPFRRLRGVMLAARDARAAARDTAGARAARRG